jgi:hypothetical protein
MHNRQERDMMAKQLFEQQKQARQSKRFDHAMDILNTMHRDYHDHASIHTQIHAQMILVYFAAGDFLRVLLQLLIIPTAAPASFFQKHFGLVRKNI